MVFYLSYSEEKDQEYLYFDKYNNWLTESEIFQNLIATNNESTQN